MPTDYGILNIINRVSHLFQYSVKLTFTYIDTYIQHFYNTVLSHFTFINLYYRNRQVDINEKEVRFKLNKRSSFSYCTMS